MSTPASQRRQSIEAYLEHLETRRKLAPLTVVNYRQDLAELAQFITVVEAERGAAMPLETLVHADIRNFAARLHGRGLHARSIARKLSAWRGFFGWLAERQRLPFNPVDGVKAPKQARPLPMALSADDAMRVVSPGLATDLLEPAQRVAALCDLAMFELLYSSGLRVSELTGLDVRYHAGADADAGAGAGPSAGWIDFDAGEVIVTGKGGRTRTVPVGSKAIEALRAWLAVRPAPGATGARDDPCVDPLALFVSGKGWRMTPRMVQMRLKSHAQAVGVPANVHPHMLRHSFASHVLQSSGDLRAVQEMLGHASIASTQIYTSLDFMHLAKVYDQAHPRAKKSGKS
jgi:integrase/recombinase XerC